MIYSIYLLGKSFVKEYWVKVISGLSRITRCRGLQRRQVLRLF